MRDMDFKIVTRKVGDDLQHSLIVRVGRGTKINRKLASNLSTEELPVAVDEAFNSVANARLTLAQRRSLAGEKPIPLAQPTTTPHGAGPAADEKSTR